MSIKALSTFELAVKGAITESLQACLETTPDDDGEPDWSDYDDLIAHISVNVQNHAKELVANLEAARPKVSNKATGKKTGAKRKNTYTQWVRVASRIRKGEIKGDKVVTVGANFRDKSTASATKYFDMKDDLELEGKDIPVEELLAHLKESMPDEKDLTLTAICWGLMPPAFRDTLVEELDV
jgi:hypothetical protein